MKQGQRTSTAEFKREMTLPRFGGVMKESDDILLTKRAATHDLAPRYFTSG